MKSIKCGECKKDFNLCVCRPLPTNCRCIPMEVIKPPAMEVRTGNIKQNTVTIKITPRKDIINGQPWYGVDNG